MIGNRYLRVLFAYPDEDTSLNQMLELLKEKNADFIDSLNQPQDLSLCTEEELKYLTKASALIDYCYNYKMLRYPIGCATKDCASKNPITIQSD